MKKLKAMLSVSLALCFLVGCNSGAPTSAVSNPEASTAAKPTNAKPNTNSRDCGAISDPAQAADCRFLKGVADAKKKHNSDNVVTHSPGSIQQP